MTQFKMAQEQSEQKEPRQMSKAVSHVIKECIWIANKAKYPILCTVDQDSFPQSRPVAVFQSTNSNKLKHVDFICFNSSLYSRKVSHISKNNNVSFSFLMKDKRIYATFNGKANKLSNKEKVCYWYEKSDRLWYPKGPESDQYQVFKVDITSLSIYSPQLQYLFRTKNNDNDNEIVLAQDPITSTPVVMKKDKDNQWFISNPKQSDQ